MTSLSRREFAALAAAAAAAPFALDPTCVAASGAAATLTARQLIDRITSQLGAPAKPDTVEAWGRDASNPVGGWYGLRKGYRGRFGMYMPPLLEALGLAELTHDAKNNRMRAI